MGSDVVIYSTAECQACRLTEQVLKAQGLDYEVVRLESDPAASALIKAMGFAQAPVISTGDQWWSGFQPDRLRSLATAQRSA